MKKLLFAIIGLLVLSLAMRAFQIYKDAKDGGSPNYWEAP